MGHEYEYYLLDAETKERLYEGIHIFHTVRNHYTPFLDQLVPTLRAYGIDVITHNCEYAGSQYETVYGPGMNIAGRRQGVRLQERHEGARAPKRLHRELHGKALRRACPAAAATCMSASSNRETGKNAFFDAGGRGRALGARRAPSPKASSRTRRR